MWWLFEIITVSCQQSKHLRAVTTATNISGAPFISHAPINSLAYLIFTDIVYKYSPQMIVRALNTLQSNQLIINYFATSQPTRRFKYIQKVVLFFIYNIRGDKRDKKWYFCFIYKRWELSYFAQVSDQFIPLQKRGKQF